METTLSLDDVISEITEHLVETDEAYRAKIANELAVEFDNDDTAVAAIAEFLADPTTDGNVTAKLATMLLSGEYVYEGDSLVTKTSFDPSP